ncbi:Alcohol dehydrogenase [Polystyrenella longa]|uniref:Alcohol dehydrogenase n=1 Tax=Polystyrenella longa TaxID=2528007 RepID=A0A518CKY3_9PLAN|nr:NAD(P)-dependent alcohol dehydrogenase [Polystyrenella longa]QDU79888.1 Alcohol dehydrogenase [Polystyrenella longa]
MRAYQIETMGDISGLKLVDLPQPTAGPGQVVVRVKACSLNFRDLMILRGQYNPNMDVPRIPLSDCSGEIVEVGVGVDTVQKGDRVCGCFMPGWQGGACDSTMQKTALGGEVDGVLSEYITLPATGVVSIPEHLSFEEAATLPCAGVTAWHAILSGKPVLPGHKVLLLGTGGVSIFALQFAKLAGATVAITSSSDDKLNFAQKLGADFTVNYRKDPDWDKTVLQWSGGEGVDHVVEVGGAGTLSKSMKAVRMSGHVALIGVLSGPGDFNPISILMKSVNVRGIYVGSRAMFESMNKAISAHKVKPIIDRTFSFDQVPQAYEHLASQDHLGKIVIKLG